MGGNAAVQAKYRCTIAVPLGEARFIDPWDPNGCEKNPAGCPAG